MEFCLPTKLQVRRRDIFDVRDSRSVDGLNAFGLFAREKAFVLLSYSLRFNVQTLYLARCR